MHTKYIQVKELGCQVGYEKRQVCTAQIQLECEVTELFNLCACVPQHHAWCTEGPSINICGLAADIKNKRTPQRNRSH